MSAFSDQYETYLVNGIFRGLGLSAPAALYLGLTSGIPNDNLPHLTELTGGNYARWALGPPSATAFIYHNVPTSGLVYLGSGIKPISSWTGGNQAVSGAFIAQSLAGADVICYGSLTTPKLITASDDLTFASGAISFQIL